MSILVAYASKHGATREIAERIAEKLSAAGLDIELQPISAVSDMVGYDAAVIGSAAYFGSWLKEATAFVRHHQAHLADRPVWLFSSGPLGTETTDEQGRALRDAAVPKEIAEFEAAIHPRDHRVFFGALDRRTLGLAERLLMMLPAARSLFSEGDFRDWPAIETWAEGIAEELTAVSGARRTAP